MIKWVNEILNLNNILPVSFNNKSENQKMKQKKY